MHVWFHMDVAMGNIQCKGTTPILGMKFSEKFIHYTYTSKYGI